MGNSRALKFLLDRGARVRAVLITNYFVSLRFHGGLEISCPAEVSMSPTKEKE